MKKIINTFKYGSAYVKKILAIIILFVILGVASLVTALVLRQLVWFFGTVICVFIVISLWQTMTINEERLHDEIKKNAGNYTMPDYVDKEGGIGNNLQGPRSTNRSEITDGFVDTSQNTEEKVEDTKEAIAENVSDKVKKGSFWDKLIKRFSRDNENLDSDDYDDSDNEDEDLDMDVLSNEIRKKRKKNKKKRKKVNKKKTKKIKDKKASASDLEDEIDLETELLRENIDAVNNNEDDYDDESEETKNKLVVIKQASDEEIAAYDKKVIKKMFHKYKVKREHKLILVDKCEKHYIKQTPAFVWVDKNEFHILLIESEPRQLVMPIFSIREVTYLKKQAVNVDTDYPAFHRENMLTNMFRPCLPDYTHSTVVSDLNSYKNLYGFGPDIYVTNNSIKAIFDLLGVDFRVDDKVTMSNKVNIYFKDAYKANILLRDNVIDANGYADKISATLDGLARSSVSYNEFKETLNLMIKNKLITQEFAMYYMDVRDKYVR